MDLTTDSQTPPPFNRRRFGAYLVVATGICVTLSACSPQETAVSSVAGPQAYDLLTKEGHGFTAGPMMAANTVYVLFDPQCPHCGHLWEASQTLLKKVKFVWIPVAFIGPASLPQGAAILTAPDPLAAMSAHETSLLSGQGGTSASAMIPDEINDAIRKNTDLFKRLGGESVPYMVAKNQRTGAVVSNAGAMEPDALAQFLGL